MSQPQLSDLVKQAKSQSAKERRAAYRLMAESRDPRTIPYLRHAYLNDEDDAVRDIAYDALAALKAIQQGYVVRSPRISNAALKKAAGFLSLTLVLTLIANVVTRVDLGSLFSSEEPSASPTAIAQVGPTDRDLLITLMQNRLDQSNAFLATLRAEIAHYNTTREVKCDLNLPTPLPIQLTTADQLTYRDLNLVGSRLDAAIVNLDSAQFQWRHSCRLPEPDVNDVLGASAALDQAAIQLQDTANLLQQAIDRPAPTTAPTFTPDPMAAVVPTNTPPALSTEDSSPESPVNTTPDASNVTPPTTTPTPTAPPAPGVTLPYPNLDYTAILGSLSRQLAVMGDLKNQFNSGMVDQWRQAQGSPGPSSTSGCRLDPWPNPFALTPDQQAQLNRTDVADPQLAQAIQLVQEGMTAAVQARALFERDCPTGTLANSAAEGIPLAEAAYSRLSSARDLIDQIRQRPTTP